MHEASIAQGILDTIFASAPKDAKITRITVVAGVFSAIQKESLELFLGELARGTAAQGAILELKTPQAQLVCQTCGQARPYEITGELPANCESCGGPNRLAGGSELYVESIEVET